MHIFWLAKANKPAPHRLDSHIWSKLCMLIELPMSWMSLKVPLEPNFLFFI